MIAEPCAPAAHELTGPRAALGLSIGGLSLDFEATGRLRLETPRQDVYAPFTTRPSRHADLTLAVGDDPAPEPDGARRFDSGDAWTLDEHRGGWLVRLAAPGRAQALWSVVLDSGLARGAVHVGAALCGADGVVRHLVQYPLDQILAMLLLARDGGLLVHAAACELDGAALVFPGVSGAGKSTLTRLLGDGAGLRWLSDDRVILRPRADGFDVHGTPWPGDAGIARAGPVPLAAIAFIDRTREGAPALGPREALAHLLRVASLPWFDAGLLAPGLDACERILAGHPTHALGFTLDAGATRKTLEAIRRGP